MSRRRSQTKYSEKDWEASNWNWTSVSPEYQYTLSPPHFTTDPFQTSDNDIRIS
jgi:hypothetical protein